MINNIALIFCLITLFSCSKDREPQFSHGAGIELENKEKYHLKTYKVITTELFEDSTDDTCPKVKVHSNSFSYINELEWVISKPGLEFEIETQVKGGKLIAYKKVTSEEILSCESVSFSKNGFSYVALASFDVEYIRVEEEVDLNGNPTGRKIEIAGSEGKHDAIRVLKDSYRVYNDSSHLQIKHLSKKDFLELYKEKPIVLKTLDIKEGHLNFNVDSKSKEIIKTTDKFPMYKHLNKLNYKVLNDRHYLTEGLDIYGIPHKEYKLEVRLENDNLVLYKICEQNSISLMEKDYAIESTKDGVKSYAVPLRTIQVTLLRIESTIKANGIPAEHPDEKVVFDSKLATHLIIQKTFHKNFKPLIEKRRGLFPANYFSSSHWYKSDVTIKKSLENNDDLVGFKEEEEDSKDEDSTKKHTAEDSFKAIARIEFYYNKANAKLELKKAISADNTTSIEHKETIKDSKGILGVKERVIKANYASNAFQEEDHLGGNSFGDSRQNKSLHVSFEGEDIDSIEIHDDYFSYTKVENGLTKRISYSRAKDDSLVQRRVYPLADHSRYGFFNVKEEKVESDVINAEDIRYFLARHYPENNIIQYYLSKSSDDTYNQELIETKDLWNKAFQTIGSPIRIAIDFTERKNFGDSRFNIIHITNLGSKYIYGAAPSLVDDLTGEIVSTNLVVYDNSIKDTAADFLRVYIDHELMRFKDKGIITREYVKHLNRKIDYTQISSSFYVTNNQEIARIHNDYYSGCSDFKQYILGLSEKNSINQYSKEKVQQVIHKCQNSISKLWVKNTLLHEMGHNLGLTHNFAASYDKRYKDNDSVVSVLDYHRDTAIGEIKKINHYDLAALAYGYEGKYHGVDQEFHPIAMDNIKLSDNISLSEKISMRSIKALEYNFCSDNDLGFMDNCLGFDIGKNIVDVTQDIIMRSHDYIMQATHRFDRAEPAYAAGAKVFKQYIRKLYNSYYKFRLKLHQFIDEKKRNDKYLTIDPITFKGVSSEQFLALINDFNQDDDYKKYADYYDASVLIFNFLKSVAIQPPRHCVFKEANGSYIAYPLYYLRQDIHESSQYEKSILYCSDPRLQNLLLVDDREFVGGVGAFYETVNDLYGEQYASIQSESIQSQKDIIDSFVYTFTGGKDEIYKFSNLPTLNEEYEKLIFSKLAGDIQLKDVVGYEYTDIELESIGMETPLADFYLERDYLITPIGEDEAKFLPFRRLFFDSYMRSAMFNNEFDSHAVKYQLGFISNLNPKNFDILERLNENESLDSQYVMPLFITSLSEDKNDILVSAFKTYNGKETFAARILREYIEIQDKLKNENGEVSEEKTSYYHRPLKYIINWSLDVLE